MKKRPLTAYAQSLVYPDKFHPDWNRSFILLPQGKPRGAAVLLHGLTDSPYSVHYLAQRYQQQGFVAVAPRLPGHGTAPARSPVDREEWIATTRLAVREATRLAGMTRRCTWLVTPTAGRWR
jgi:alpha-beta hydrolase superfamily lysophospholipase